MREKTDKFQQRRLDGFFTAGVKAADEGNAAEEPEAPAMLEVIAMEIEMEVCRPSVPFSFRPTMTNVNLQCKASLYLVAEPKSQSMLAHRLQPQCPF